MSAGYKCSQCNQHVSSSTHLLAGNIVLNTTEFAFIGTGYLLKYRVTLVKCGNSRSRTPPYCLLLSATAKQVTRCSNEMDVAICVCLSKWELLVERRLATVNVTWKFNWRTVTVGNIDFAIDFIIDDDHRCQTLVFSWEHICARVLFRYICFADFVYRQ